MSCGVLAIMGRWVRGTFSSRIKTFCLKCKRKIGKSGIFSGRPASPGYAISGRFPAFPAISAEADRHGRPRLLPFPRDAAGQLAGAKELGDGQNRQLLMSHLRSSAG